jgi:multisubunit Na+/H+ antiporter MnhE subunit
MLLVHVLALEDESSMVRFIQDRYERPLREIFE